MLNDGIPDVCGNDSEEVDVWDGYGDKISV